MIAPRPRFRRLLGLAAAIAVAFSTGYAVVATASAQRSLDPVEPEYFPGVGLDAARDERLFAEEALLREQVIKRCMAQAGLGYELSPPVVVHPGQQPPPESPRGAEHDDSYNLVLYGTVDPNDAALPSGIGGCLGVAHEMVPGSFRMEPALRTARDDLRAAIGEVRQAHDPKCLRRSPAATARDPLSPETDASIATARAEAADCQKSSQGSEAEIRALQAKFIADHRHLLRAHADRVARDRRAGAAYAGE